MRLEDMDAVIARTMELLADICEGNNDYAEDSAQDILARLREWRESAVEGWVMRWSAGPWEVHPNAEPDDHDGRGLLLITTATGGEMSPRYEIPDTEHAEIIRPGRPT